MEKVNRAHLLRSVLPSVAFEIRAEMTPTYGFLQVLRAECSVPHTARELLVLQQRLQEVEAMLRAWIDWGLHPERHATEAGPPVSRIAAVRTVLADVYKGVVGMHGEGRIDLSPDRLTAMLQGLWLAERMCRELEVLAE